MSLSPGSFKLLLCWQTESFFRVSALSRYCSQMEARPHASSRERRPRGSASMRSAAAGSITISYTGREAIMMIIMMLYMVPTVMSLAAGVTDYRPV